MGVEEDDETPDALPLTPEEGPDSPAESDHVLGYRRLRLAGRYEFGAFVPDTPEA